MRPDEGEILEDLIVAAHNDAKAKVEAEMQEKPASSPPACSCHRA